MIGPNLPPILFEEGGIIAINKPQGLPSTGRTLEDENCLQHQLMTHYRRRIWAVHQLDSGTTGVNLFVRRKKLVQALSLALKQGEKTYLALCHGRPNFEHLSIDKPIGFDTTQKRRWIHPEGKSAISHVKILASNKGASLLSIQIETGRTHQIRIHLASIGHPLIGDDRYGKETGKDPDYPALHAQKIHLKGDDFPDLIIEAPLPKNFVSLGNQLGLGDVERITF